MELMSLTENNTAFASGCGYEYQRYVFLLACMELEKNGYVTFEFKLQELIYLSNLLARQKAATNFVFSLYDGIRQFNLPICHYFLPIT